MKPSEKKGGENWTKFLKELQDPQMMAILNDDPMKHLNRATARKHGEVNATELEKKILEKRKTLADFRDFTCGKWMHEKMKVLWPEWLLKRTLEKGNTTARILGWYWGVEHKPQFAANGNEFPRMYPSTFLFIARKRFWFFGKMIIKEQQLLHWNEEGGN